MATTAPEKTETITPAELENKVPIKGNVDDFMAKQVQKQKEKGLPFVEGALVNRQDGDRPEKPEEKGIKTEKKPSFTKSLKLENEEATRKLEQYETELKTFKETEIPGLNKQIEDLKSQLEAAGTNKESTDIQGRITALEDEKRTISEDYQKKLTDAQNRLKFYDLLEDPDFQSRYVEPINGKYGEIQHMLEDNDNLQQMFLKAMSSNAAALRSPDPKQARALEKARDQLLYELEQELPPYEQRRFRSLTESQIGLLLEQAKAIQNHEVTGQKIREARTNAQREGQIRTYNTWKGLYDQNAEAAQKDAEIPDDLQGVAKELALDLDTTEDEEAARAAFSSADYPPEKITKVLAQGTQAKRYKAHIQVLQKALQDRDDVIKKLRGAEPSGSESAKTGAETNGKPKDLSGFLQRFGKGVQR